MKEVNFAEIEKKWQSYWRENQSYKASENSDRPKYYVLTMFPYPSGKGLHVGHPLSYVAADIIARYKKLKGYEVLHPMGFDAFGLPAEQYAIQTGQHPAITTKENIATYKRQLEILGLSYDWDREVITADPSYFKWTQWIFGQLFNAFFDAGEQKAKPIAELISRFEEKGCSDSTLDLNFTAEDWKSFDAAKKESILQNFRLAYLAYTEVNWCEELGTVLANDEVINGKSERGGHPVTKKKMRQWSLRITAYSERLLSGLDTIDWPSALKEIQKNWIGKSTGAELNFTTYKPKNNASLDNPLCISDAEEISEHAKITVFTTRPDTVFGSTFLVLAPEYDQLDALIHSDQAQEVAEYIDYVKSRSERERMSEVKKVTGVFTGAYAQNPFTQKLVPIWISEYVLAGYGTGAIMAVPAHDSRDYSFAKKFNLPILEVISGGNIAEEAYESKVGKLINSDLFNGKDVSEAIEIAVAEIEKNNWGTKKINYRLRDAGFSRQRYWGEPFPVVFDGETPILLDEKDLPLELPEVASYEAIGTGESPIASARDWVEVSDRLRRETDTMPGYAGSSWYWLRYMDPSNQEAFVGKDKESFWNQVDLYIGGAEHAVGHLLYARLWQKVLFDLGLVSMDEPFKKMVNQGMIQGNSKLVNRVVNQSEGTVTYVSAGIKSKFNITDRVHVDVSLVDVNDNVDIEGFKAQRREDADILFELEEGNLICETEAEKMSKRWLNVVNPEEMVQKYGADTFRMYEMFLGPITDSKPWNTNGIDGVFKFLRKFYNLFFDKSNELSISEEKPTKDEWRILHTCIQRVQNDIDKLSLNTCVSHFMICTNELQALKSSKREILKPLTVLLSPFAPHLCEELWSLLGEKESITKSVYPAFEPSHLTVSEHTYPIMINGKMRAKIVLAIGVAQEDAIAKALEMPEVQKWTEGKRVKKAIFVPKKILNLVLG